MKQQAWSMKDARRWNTSNYRPKGSGRVIRCAACQRRLICARVGVVFLCVACRGGQGL